MVQLRPVTAISNLDGRPIDGVEVHVILSHELVQVDIFWIEPPLLPLWKIVGCNTGVSDGCIELHREVRT